MRLQCHGQCVFAPSKIQTFQRTDLGTGVVDRPQREITHILTPRLYCQLTINPIVPVRRGGDLVRPGFESIKLEIAVGACLAGDITRGKRHLGSIYLSISLYVENKTTDNPGIICHGSIFVGCGRFQTSSQRDNA